MIGTVVNTATVLCGSFIGLTAGKHLPERIKDIMMQALGLSVILIGLQMALSGNRVLLTIGSLLLGGITGEILGIEKSLEHLANRLKKLLRSDSSTFVDGFVSASLLYLVGAMTIVGTIQDGTAHDPGTLYVKSLLDGVASIALASSLGVGVAFSAISVLVVQGALTLAAARLSFLQGPEVLNAVTSTGGLLILGIGITLLQIKKIRTGNLLPALVYAIAGALLL
ncbi:MAG: DUF554 domain-containing protein [Deltaproteobacteria bacterium]|nr:DUF554 domain-containing protein [Deltaproteobacteria bacterium]